ncbi:MAG: hypothetical protein H7Z14_12850 [Anaerolineae bacterium]|nr:hypothetical protein [Phycisphaerae bacterium]
MTNADDIVLIVPAGRGAAKQAQLFDRYHCQNRGSFQPFQYIAFYERGNIEIYARVADPPEHDVVMSARSDLRALTKHTQDHNGNPNQAHSLYRLLDVRRLDPAISNDSRTGDGREVAFVQNQRYTTLGRVLSARTTSELV